MFSVKIPLESTLQDHKSSLTIHIYTNLQFAHKTVVILHII